MKRLIAVAVLCALAAPAAAEDKLTGKLIVKDLQGGFAGLTGKQWTIDTDGKWEEGNVFRQKVTVTRSGTLDKKALEKLAAEVKKYEAGTLKNEGKPGTNPKVVGVSYGKNSAELTLKPGADLPKADAKTNEGRFSGIVAAVKAAIPPAKK